MSGDASPSEATTETTATSEPAAGSESAPAAEGSINLAEGTATPAPSDEGTPPAEGQSTDDTQQSGSEDGQPSSYEPFTLPDGYTASDEDLSVFTEIATKFGLDQDNAQGLVDLGVQLVQNERQAIEAESQQAFEQMQNGWKDQLRDDPDLGGENLATTQKNVDAFERSGVASPELMTFLKDNGLVFHPEFVRFFDALGRTIQEDPITFGSDEGESGASGAQRMFAKSGHV